MISISVITDELTQARQLLREKNLEDKVFLANYSLVKNTPPTEIGSEKIALAPIEVYVINNEITIEPDWGLQTPPVLFPLSLPYSKNNLLAIIYLFLGDEQAALDYTLQNKVLEKVILSFTALKHQIPVSLDPKEIEKGNEVHNLALLSHYGLLPDDLDFNGIKKLYNVAIELSETNYRQIFTKYYYSLFLLDAGIHQEASNILSQLLKLTLPLKAKLVLKYQYVDAILSGTQRQEQLPMLKIEVKALLDLSRELLDEYREAMVLQLAAEVAELDSNYMEALGCLQKALNYYVQNNFDTLAANVQYKKGELLLTWSRRGNPSMFSQAANSYRDALQVFTKETAPETFAQVHHKLGMIYADMPFQKEKRAMIAALSVTSFNEALSFFAKETYPYEYASIQQDLGNAYLKYPESLHNDNYKKAIQHYQEALLIRTKEDFPLERSITLLNYLEALWLLPQEERLSESLLEEMESMANEVINLEKDKGLVQEAQRHLADLEKLKMEMNDA